MRARPPYWVQSLLKRFADEDTLEEIEGDLLEFYPMWIKEKGVIRANLKYFFTVITLLRPLRKRRRQLSNATMISMIRSYFIMSWRTILKNRVSSLINLSGLTLGLTTSLLILLVVVREFEYDGQHLNKDAIFLMMKNQETNDGISTGRSTPGPLAETLKSEYSQVLHASRVAYFYGTSLILNNNKSQESGIYIDPDMFRMMTYPSVKGDPVAALERNSVVISKSMAEKLFGDSDPIGQTIVLNNNALSVGAVVEDIPETNTIKFRIAVPFKVFEQANNWLVKWDDNRIQTWVQLHSGDDITGFNKEVYSLIDEKTKNPKETAFAYPLTRLHLYGGFSNGQPSGGLIAIIWVLVGFGVFMLLIACVNFMNIATAQSSHRAKEVGIRKVLGSPRHWIVFQFLNEALVITFIALVSAIGLCVLVIPSFNTMMHTSISFDFSKVMLWITCLCVALITALIAGSYPAFVLSRFTPVRVLKGIIDHQRGFSLRRVLVTFQFVISIAVLTGTIILYAQFDYVKDRPVGYNQNDLINISLDSLASVRFSTVKNEVLKLNGVEAVTGLGGNILYSNGSITGMDWPGKKPEDDLAVAVAEAEYDWSKTMGIKIVAGRDFASNFKSDENACLLNQSAVDKMGLINPIGSIVGGHTVIGVFKDFVYNDPSGVIAPMTIFLKTDNVNRLYVRIDKTTPVTETIASIEKTIKQISPDLEFEYRFTADEYQSHFEEISDVSAMISIFGGMTIFISCLGLFGLSGFIAERRGKEMSIRKVFGADSLRVLWSLSSDVLKPVVVALIIVIPLSVWVAEMSLERMVYRVSLTWWMFAKAVIAVITIAFLVVLYHGRRTANESPSVRLKSE